MSVRDMCVDSRSIPRNCTDSLVEPKHDQTRPDALHGAEHDSEADRILLCVLASGSAGNCSVLLKKSGGVTRACLIDLGLSPRATFRLLDSIGLRPDQIDDALLTHLDSDHIHPGWTRSLPVHTRLHVHRTHARQARAMGLRGDRGLGHRFCLYDTRFDLAQSVTASPILLSHDDQGVVALRFDIADLGSSRAAGALGYATDLGRATPELIDHMRGVNVLAIESNYCPRRQLASPRPEFLKRRIMGGSGHLSNEEALTAIRAIAPSEHVVLLHLSQQCNCPDHVRSLHEGADYALTISTQSAPTRWVRVSPTLGCMEFAGDARHHAACSIVRGRQMPLFGSAVR